MNERDHIAKEAKRTLDDADALEQSRFPMMNCYPALKESAAKWRQAGRPLLSARTKAILEAVENELAGCEKTTCERCEVIDDKRLCPLTLIRRAAKGES